MMEFITVEHYILKDERGVSDSLGVSSSL